jgi:hypothetical protein
MGSEKNTTSISKKKVTEMLGKTSFVSPSGWVRSYKNRHRCTCQTSVKEEENEETVRDRLSPPEEAGEPKGRLTADGHTFPRTAPKNVLTP